MSYDKCAKILMPLTIMVAPTSSVEDKVIATAEWLADKCHQVNLGSDTGSPLKCPFPMFDCPLLTPKMVKNYEVCDTVTAQDWKDKIEKHLIYYDPPYRNEGC